MPRDRNSVITPDFSAPYNGFMPHTLDFFFYIGSTCTYLAVNRAEDIAASSLGPAACRQPPRDIGARSRSSMASSSVDVYDRRDLPINEWWDWRMVAFAYQ
jgi:hypothetical protein